MNKRINSPLRFMQVMWRGMVMGMADLVPGVSGGTLALILGIYPRFIGALSRIDVRDALAMRSFDNFKTLWEKVDASFLLAIVLGMLSSIVLGAHVVDQLLTQKPDWVFAVFFGLIAASLPWLFAQISQWNKTVYALVGVGIVCGLCLSLLVPVQAASADIASWLWVLGGFLAISAMLMPGISGSFLLVLIGLYPSLLAAISHGKWGFLLLFLTGVVAGFMSVPRLIRFLLARHWSATLGLLIGVVLGALAKIWPWHAVVEKHSITLSVPRLPAVAGDDAIVVAALMLGGALVAQLILRLSPADTNTDTKA